MKYTLDLVTLEAKHIIQEKTGLKVRIIPTRQDSYELQLWARSTVLGSTSVTKTLEGKFIVGGMNSGAFNSNAHEASLINTIKKDFEELENEANGSVS